MAGCDEIQVPGVSRRHLQEFLNQGAKMGMPGLAGQGDSGEVTHSGVTVRWDYREQEQVLLVQCTKAPVLLPCAMINTRIQEAIASVMKQDTVREQA